MQTPGTWESSTKTPERLVYVGRVHRRAEVGSHGPRVAVIELDLQALLRIVEGFNSPGLNGGGDGRQVRSTFAAWPHLPSRSGSPAYEALMTVHDASVQWRQPIWADEAVLEAFGPLLARRSTCTLRDDGLTWRVAHPVAGELWTDPLPIFQIYRAFLFLGTPFYVRYFAAAMAATYPELMANALRDGVGPRFGVAYRDIAGRSIRELVGREQLRPLLWHDDDRVRRAASEALDLQPRVVSA